MRLPVRGLWLVTLLFTGCPSAEGPERASSPEGSATTATAAWRRLDGTMDVDTQLHALLSKAKASKRPALIDFSATWCAPCKALAPILDDIAAAKPDISIVKVNIDDAPAAAAAAAITSVPTLLFFRDGELYDEIRGAASKQAILAKLA